jgi:hypothetical protein
MIPRRGAEAAAGSGEKPECGDDALEDHADASESERSKMSMMGVQRERMGNLNGR